MPFKIENIDRAIEWAIRDEVIRVNGWPDERSFISSPNESAYNAAINAIPAKDRIDTFGVGNYKDREQLKMNNIIIEMEGIYDGNLGIGNPMEFELMPDKTYNKNDLGGGSSTLEYEVRFVCDNVALDRIINTIMLKALGKRKFIYGMNDDLTNMTDGFWVERNGNPVNLSGKNYIERLFRFIIRDVFIDECKVVETGISMVTEITSIQNIPGELNADIENPSDNDDVSSFVIGPLDYFKGQVQDLSCFNKWERANIYATNNQANALKNLVGYQACINSGLTFVPYKGFVKTNSIQYLNTNFYPSISSKITLTNFCYSIFVTDVPTTGLLELFGLKDVADSLGFYFTSSPSSGIKAKANSNNELASAWELKANTLYSLNRKNRFQMEIYEAARLIAVLELEPTAIPSGKIAELNIFDESGAAIGTSAAGGVAFSAIGESLSISEIRELNAVLRLYLAKVGLIVS
jgi:hypothetical protein